MPPREAKGRYLTREYFADHDFMTRLNAEQREFYLLLSLFADDAGWLEWDAEYLMYTIYRYDESRIVTFVAATGALERTGRLKTHRCGHAVLPKVSKRPRMGVTETKVKDQHEAVCNKKGVSNRSKGHRVQSGPIDATRHATLPQPNPTSTSTSTLPTARMRARGHKPTDQGETAKDNLKRMGYDPARAEP